MRSVSASRGSSLSWVLAAIVILILILAMMFFWKWWGVSHSKVVAPKPAAMPPAAAQAVVAPAPPVAAPAVTRATPAQDAPVEEPVWPVELTLKAIFYSRTSPHALLNGKTVGPGDYVGEVRVARIEEDRVVVVWDGHTKELVLREH
jgi:hypothetical protein